MKAFSPDIMPGTPGLAFEDTRHILIPGCGRTADGNGPSLRTVQRAEFAAELYTQAHFADHDGRVVSSGYKTPGDTNGDPFKILSKDGIVETFIGMPEAIATVPILVLGGVPRKVIHTEHHSTNSPTNLVRSEHEGHFGNNDYPVAIVGHEAHLDRILTEIAPKTLRRPYLGVKVPEDPGDKFVDSVFARMASKVTLLGVTPETEDILEITQRRADRIWNIALAFKGLIFRNAAYNTDS